MELKLKDGYQELWSAEKGLLTSLEFSGEGVPPIDVTLQKTVGYLNGGEDYFKQLSPGSAAHEKILPLLWALDQLYYYQEVALRKPATDPNHTTIFSVSHDQEVREQISGLRAFIGTCAGFVPIEPKQGRI